MTHTPGPWVREPEYEGDPATFVHAKGRAIADCHNGYGEEDEDNARLIAAAPELLAALKALANLDKRCGWHSAALDQANAAIAKAEGATSSAIGTKL